MLQFRLLGIPVRVQPWFFVTALLIGPRQLVGIATWVPVVFVGVLAHELGHAWAVRRVGGQPAIELHGFGGVTRWRGEVALSSVDRIVISGAGSAVGIVIGATALVAASVVGPQQLLLARVLGYAAWVNLGWGLLNLLPVLPLDGGTIVVTLAQSLWGSAGVRIARITSLVVCVALGAAALAVGWIWSAIIAGVLALANLQALRSDGPHPPDVGVVPGSGME